MKRFNNDTTNTFSRPHRRGIHSIQIKLGVALVIVTTVILCGFGMYQYRQLRSEKTAELTQLAQLAVERLSQSLAAPLWFVDTTGQIEAALISEMQEKRIYAIVVRNPDDSLIEAAHRNQDWEIVMTEEDIASDDWITQSTTITKDGSELGVVELYAADHFMKRDLKQASVKLLWGIGFLDMALFLFLSLTVRRMLIRPLNRLLMSADAIAHGDFSQEIPVRQRDEIGDLARAFRYMKERINLVLKETESLLQDVQNGHLEARGHAEAFRGGWKSLVKGINDVLDAFVTPFKMTAGHLDRLAKGDLPEPIQEEFRGDFNEMKQHLNALIEATHETTRVAEAIAAGQLDVEARQRSEHDRLMQALNHMIEAFLVPLNTTSHYLDRIGKGDLPEPIMDEYKGDFDLIKQNVNLLIEASQDITYVAQEMSAGNFLVTVKQRSEHDQLMQALNQMIHHITSAMRDVKETAAHLAGGSEQLSHTAGTMSQGAAQQASAAEEVSSAMEQMAANISQNTENARRTEQIAREAANYAQESAQVVAETVVAMQQIAEKIQIIQEIAMQTRLLSLNATIESARAHEHGKAFSVVAAEVRKLSDVTRNAAEEIGKLTTSTLRISHKAGDMLQTLAPSIQQTAELVQEIAAASREQSSGAEHINAAIQQLDLVTQQNASTSEEVSTAAEELTSQAQSLRETVAFFRFEYTDEKKGIMPPAESKTRPLREKPEEDDFEWV